MKINTILFAERKLPHVAGCLVLLPGQMAGISHGACHEYSGDLGQELFRTDGCSIYHLVRRIPAPLENIPALLYKNRKRHGFTGKGARIFSQTARGMFDIIKQNCNLWVKKISKLRFF